MSTSSQQPRSDRTVIAIAWAAAAIVVALVVAFIAWLALGQRDAGTSTAAPVPSASSETTPSPDPDGDDDADQPPSSSSGDDDADQPPSSSSGDDGAGAGEAPTDPGGTEQTPPPEVAQMMLDLQRRDPDDPLAVGDVDAPVVMIEYADYRCPYCAQFHLDIRPDLMPLVEDGALRIEFRDFVIFEETSQLAAVAARAAAEQDRLEEFQDAVFALSTEGHGEYGEAELIDIAQEVGVADLERFEADLTDEELLAAVEADTAEARSIGVASTPTFLINTQVLQGAYPADRVIEIIEEQQQVASQQS